MSASKCPSVEADERAEQCCPRRAANLLLFARVDYDEVDNDDHTDRLPHVLQVRRVDLLVMALSLVG